MEKNKTKNIVISLVILVLVAGLGSLFVMLGNEWFNGTVKPSQWIPNFVIPIVWSIIYISFGVLIVRIINREELTTKTAVLSIINGVLNVLWCLVFFTLNLTFLGNIIIVINLVFSYLLWIDINSKSRLYGYILALYPLWLSLATTLNLAIWILN